MVTWLRLKSLRTSGVYWEARSGSRYNVRISNWLLQSHVTILKQALCKFSRKLCGSDFNRFNNQNRSFLPTDEWENHFRRQMVFFPKHYRNKIISQLRCPLIFLFDIKKSQLKGKNINLQWTKSLKKIDLKVIHQLNTRCLKMTYQIGFHLLELNLIIVKSILNKERFIDFLASIFKIFNFWLSI